MLLKDLRLPVSENIKIVVQVLCDPEDLVRLPDLASNAQRSTINETDEKQAGFEPPAKSQLPARALKATIYAMGR
jgi:hypothetical protein